MTRRLDYLGLAVFIGGVVAVIAGAIGALGEDETAFALPFVASGVIGGLAMVVFGAGVVQLQRSRRAAVAAHQEHVARLLDEVTA